MQFILIFWAFTLMWKTFLFRFGLLSRLFVREFPLLFFIPLNFILFLGEKGYRIVSKSNFFEYFKIFSIVTWGMEMIQQAFIMMSDSTFYFGSRESYRSCAGLDASKQLCMSCTPATTSLTGGSNSDCVQIILFHF